MNSYLLIEYNEEGICYMIQTVCPSIKEAVRKFKYHPFTNEDVEEGDHLEKKAFKYFGIDVPKYSATEQNNIVQGHRSAVSIFEFSDGKIVNIYGNAHGRVFRTLE